MTYENSVVLVLEYLASVALKTGVGTWYSAMKLPLVSLTLRVTPRLIVCRRLQAESTPDVTVEMVDSGRTYGSPNSFGSTALFVKRNGGVNNTGVRR